MACLSTPRVIADPATSATEGRVAWDAPKSLFTGGMTVAALILAPLHVTAGAVAAFVALTAVTICFGHSIGMHRLLIHRSFEAPLWLERLLVYLGVLVGMAGPIGMARLHDTRDWAQRQTDCHDLHAHRAGFWTDAWRQLHCRLELAHPPRFAPEPRLADDRVYRFLEATWMLQQVPIGLAAFAIGGLPWLVWCVPVRVAVSLTGHWLVGHITHKRGPQGWAVDGVAVQGHDLPKAALITFGEAWHGNHHAWPESARLGVEPGQADPGWWALVTLRQLGLVWNLKEPAHLEPREGLRRVAPVAPHESSCRASSAASASISSNTSCAAVRAFSARGKPA
ncbi:acyl-CoA desaturase [Methylopila henanensis]|uniref:Acyl-CoA desaturase n=1 Tax=Methylopila henanensis TaxID=873516 RepID=A0ABW4K3M6_9HYPH